MLNLDTAKCENSLETITVPRELYEKGCVNSETEGLTIAKKIGFPVMIKASEGGGGKGIRKVTDSKQFPPLFRQVCYFSYFIYNETSTSCSLV